MLSIAAIRFDAFGDPASVQQVTYSNAMMHFSLAVPSMRNAALVAAGKLRRVQRPWSG